MKPEMLQLTKYDFIDSIRLAIEKLSYQKFGISLSDAGSVFLAGKSLTESLKEVGALLLPYCAKPPECDYRNIDGCSKCGLCSVGDAYKMAEKKGLKPITITNYEHLKNTLHSLKEDGVKSYIGCCCEAFFIKRHEAFAEAGISGVLIDIENRTCYELKKEDAAYKGDFQEKTELKIDLLKKLLEVRSK